VRTLIEQLRDAYEKTGWTMEHLLGQSGLDLDRSSLRRKLLDVDDPIPMKTDEAEALARALDVTLVVVPGEHEKKSRAS
jgi:hypothetical protein